MDGLGNPQIVSNGLAPDRKGQVVVTTSAPPYVTTLFNFDSVKINGLRFVPVSCTVDNTQGVANGVSLEIFSQRMQQNIATVPPGVVQSFNFLSIEGDTYEITEATASPTRFSWSNIPQTPYMPLAATVDVLVIGKPNVTIANTISNSTAVLVSGEQFESYHGQLNSGTQNFVVDVTQDRLYRVLVSVSGNTTQAVAGDNTFTISVDGTIIYSETLYIPATVSGQPYRFEVLTGGQYYFISTDFSAALSGPLASGQIDVNAFLGY